MRKIRWVYRQPHGVTIIPSLGFLVGKYSNSGVNTTLLRPTLARKGRIQPFSVNTAHYTSSDYFRNSFHFFSHFHCFILCCDLFSQKECSDQKSGLERPMTWGWTPFRTPAAILVTPIGHFWFYRRWASAPGAAMLVFYMTFISSVPGFLVWVDLFPIHENYVNFPSIFLFSKYIFHLIGTIICTGLDMYKS